MSQLIPTPRAVFNDIESVAMTVEGISRQLEWHADVLLLAAPEYSGPLSISGLMDIFDSLSKQLAHTADRLQGMAELAGKLGGKAPRYKASAIAS